MGLRKFHLKYRSIDMFRVDILQALYFKNLCKMKKKGLSKLANKAFHYKANEIFWLTKKYLQLFFIEEQNLNKTKITSHFFPICVLFSVKP